MIARPLNHLLLPAIMKKATFKIRRKIILAFLFSVLSVLIFAVFSFQVHREIGNRLKLMEGARQGNSPASRWRRSRKSMDWWPSAWSGTLRKTACNSNGSPR